MIRPLGTIEHNIVGFSWEGCVGRGRARDCKEEI